MDFFYAIKDMGLFAIVGAGIVIALLVKAFSGKGKGGGNSNNNSNTKSTPPTPPPTTPQQ